MGNAGIVDLGDRALVFDTFANHLAAEDLKRAAVAVTGKPVDFVVNSHPHRDHVKGNQVFPDATIAATRTTCEVMTQNWKARTERVRQEGLDPLRKAIEEEFDAWAETPATTGADRILWKGYREAILEGIEAYSLRLPTVTFESALRFHGSKRTADALTFGGGHSASDALLFVPDAEAAFLGDLLFIGVQPFLADGDPDAYLGILDKIEALDAKTLVPGHGPVGTSKDLQLMRDYVVALQRLADRARASKRDPKEVARDPVPAPFRAMAWKAFWPENVEFMIRRRGEASGP